MIFLTKMILNQINLPPKFFQIPVVSWSKSSDNNIPNPEEMLEDIELLNEIDFIKNILPKDWKVIKAKSKVGHNSSMFIISPFGKRFTSFDDAIDFMENEKHEDNSEKGKMRKKIFISPENVLRYQQKFWESKRKSTNATLLKNTLQNNHLWRVVNHNCPNFIEYQKTLMRKREMFLLQRMNLKGISKGA